MATDFVEKFKKYLNEDGKSPKTIESYVGDIAGFVAYIQNMGVKFQGELKRFYATSFRNHIIEWKLISRKMVWTRWKTYKR